MRWEGALMYAELLLSSYCDHMSKSELLSPA